MSADLEPSTTLSVLDGDEDIDYLQLGVVTLSGAPGRRAVLAYLASLAPGSHETMAGSLTTIASLLGQQSADDVPWHMMRYEHCAAIRAQLAQRYAASTANKMLSALRGVIRTSWRLGLMTAEQREAATSVENVRGERVLRGREVTADERKALLQACWRDLRPAGRRDAAMVALLYVCGIRRAECVALTLADYDQQHQRLLVHGKGNKERLVYLADPGAQDALSDWLALRGDWEGAIFCRVSHTGLRLLQAPLSRRAVDTIIRHRAEQAGLAHMTPHDFRRTFAGDLLDAGADIATVQKMMGHAKVDTTARYDRRPEATKRRAAALLSVPYERREQETKR